MRKSLSIGLLLTLLVSSLACSKDENLCADAQQAKLINRSGLDGCGWLIELQNSDRLEPINLGDFEMGLEEDKKVWVRYKVESGMGSICMVGEIVSIVCLAER